MLNHGLPNYQKLSCPAGAGPCPTHRAMQLGTHGVPYQRRNTIFWLDAGLSPPHTLFPLEYCGLRERFVCGHDISYSIDSDQGTYSAAKEVWHRAMLRDLTSLTVVPTSPEQLLGRMAGVPSRWQCQAMSRCSRWPFTCWIGVAWAVLFLDLHDSYALGSRGRNERGTTHCFLWWSTINILYFLSPWPYPLLTERSSFQREEHFHQEA